jgi:hypothetical protein
LAAVAPCISAAPMASVNLVHSLTDQHGIGVGSTRDSPA